MITTKTATKRTGTELDIDLADVIHEQHQNEFVYTNTTIL